MCYGFAMNPNLAAQLLNADLTEQQIADEVGCNQSSIHRIIHGRDPAWCLGDAIIAEYRIRNGKPLSLNQLLWLCSSVAQPARTFTPKTKVITLDRLQKIIQGEQP
jgi:hypothetical protein